jgi:hypothetical protein
MFASCFLSSRFCHRRPFSRRLAVVAVDRPAEPQEALQQVLLAPTGKRRLVTAHTRNGHRIASIVI